MRGHRRLGLPVCWSWLHVLSTHPIPPRPAPPYQGWCTLTDIPRFIYLMEKVGLYRRLHTPATLLRQHERRIQAQLRAAEGAPHS